MATFKNTATGGENAIEGVASTGRGIVGFSNGNYGVSGDSQSFAGVRGTSNFSRGVEGWSTHSEGVFGITKGGVAAVWGLSGSRDVPGVVGTSSSRAPGVVGTNSAEQGVAIVAFSELGPGLTAESGGGGFGVVARGRGGGGAGLDFRKGGVEATALESGIGVKAMSFGERGIGVAAISDTGVALLAAPRSSDGRAAEFYGPVDVRGVLTVFDKSDFGNVFIAHELTVTGIKSAAVPHPDGMHRRLYCIESPECWFEDFGEASLKKGVAIVKLDREFAALVKTGRYHVFLSSYDSVQLYVSKRSREGFEIRALPNATGKLPQRARCAYRIVARRKDVKAPRLAKVKIPARRKRPPFPKFLKSPVHLSKRTHDQFAALRKAERKQLREFKRFTATAGDIFGAPAKAARRSLRQPRVDMVV